MIKENFTIVIPAYNEEGTIRDVVKRALKQCNHSVANIEKAIVRAGTGLGWVMTKKSDKHIVGKLALRKHLAVIDIPLFPLTL
jgi:predicted naringenin-chalcone synthase